MFLPMVGSIYNSLKTTELEMKWQQRKKDPNWESMDERSREIARLQETAADVRKSNVTSAINGKLMAGAQLTDQELAYLKQTNPQLYQEAMQISQERRAYEKELENCETKDEVEEKKAAKMQQLLSQAKTISSNPNIPEGEKYKQLTKISARTMGICSEHNRFLKTLRYAQLPREYELEREKKEREKEKTGDSKKASKQEDVYLNDEDMLKKLDELTDGICKGNSTEKTEQPEETAEAGPEETGGARADAGTGKNAGKPASVPAGAHVYDARGSVKAAPAPVRARFDVKY